MQDDHLEQRSRRQSDCWSLDEALDRAQTYARTIGKPRIFNTDQGAQFTSAAFTGKLEAASVAISMDGRGRFMDNIFIERLWRSIKYEEVHLKAYADAREARAGIGSWMTFYNFRRPHQAMNNQMPMAVWRAGMDKIEAAANAVDMPLRLGNANPLPASPQQKQQKDKGRRDYILNPRSRGPTNGVQFSCRRTLGEPKQNTGHWERQVTAVGPSQTKLVRHNHKCRRIPGPAATSSILRSSNSPISINCGRPSAA